MDINSEYNYSIDGDPMKLFMSYEMALKLKAKGFDGYSFGYYDKEGKFEFINYAVDIYFHHNSNLYNPISAPMYSVVVDWLRDKYGLTVVALSQNDSFFPHVCNTLTGGFDFECDDFMDVFEEMKVKRTYYEALTFAINEALKLIE